MRNLIVSHYSFVQNVFWASHWRSCDMKRISASFPQILKSRFYVLVVCFHCLWKSTKQVLSHCSPLTYVRHSGACRGHATCQNGRKQKNSTVNLRAFFSTCASPFFCKRWWAASLLMVKISTCKVKGWRISKETVFSHLNIQHSFWR